MKQYIQREPLTSDLIFKAVYGQDNSTCKKALILLLNLILERTADPIVNLHYKNPFSLAENSSEKVIVMDILVEASKGEQINIEMQIDVSGSFINRTVFYRCDLLTQGLEKGEDYAKLKKSIVIVPLPGIGEAALGRKASRNSQAARRMEARELGFSEGEGKAKRSIFLHMKKQGLSFAQIEKLTGLTEEEMEKF